MQRDPRQRVMWLSKAAQRNHPESIYDLAFAYMEGDGMAQDLPKAVTLFRQCGAIAGKIGASCLDTLGVLYWNGEGVLQDRAAAQKIWRRCAAANARCAERLKRSPG